MEHKKPVTILRDADGQAVGVMVETFDERFALELHPIDNGKEYTWDEAMARLKELGKHGISKKQMQIISAYSKEVNEALAEAGGDELGWEWAVGEYRSHSGWLYYPPFGALSTGNKYYAYQVRPRLASELIEKLLHSAV